MTAPETAHTTSLNADAVGAASTAGYQSLRKRARVSNGGVI